MEHDRYEPQETPDAHQQSEQPDRAPFGDAGTSGVPSILSTFGLGTTTRFVDTQQAISALNAPAWPVRVAAVRALGKLGEQAPVEALVTALADEHEAVRAGAVRALGGVGERVPLAPLIAALHDPSWHVRSASVMALGKLGERVPLLPLATALADEDEAVRAAAAWALGKRGEQASLELLVNALHDPAWSVREAVALALGELGQEAAVGPLLAASKDEDPTVCQAVEQALQRTYPEILTPPPMHMPDVPITDANQNVAPHALAQEQAQLIPSDEQEQLPQARQNGHGALLFFRQKDRIEATNLPEVHSEAEEVQPREPLSLQESRRHSQPNATPGRQASIRPKQTTHNSLRAIVSLAERGLIAAVLIGIMLSTWFVLHQGQSSNVVGPNGPIIFNSHAQVQKIEWAADNRHLLLADTEGGLQIWDMRTKQLTRINGSFSRTLAATWKGSDLYLATLATNGSRGEVAIEQVNDELTVRPLKYIEVDVPAPGQEPVAAFWTDGQNVRLALGSADGKVQVHDVITNTPITTFPTDTRDDTGNAVSGYVTAIAWTRDGTKLATAIDDPARTVNNIYLQEWDAATGAAINKSNKDVSVKVVTMAWSPNAEYVVHGSEDGTIGLWNPEGAKETAVTNVFSPSQQHFHPTLAWSQDNTHFATTTASGGVQIWDTTGNPVRYFPAYSQINDVTWSPDGQYLAWANADGTVQVQPAP